MNKLKFRKNLLSIITSTAFLFFYSLPVFAEVPAKVLLQTKLSDENLSGISEFFGARSVSLATNENGKSLLSYSSEDDSSKPSIRFLNSGKKRFLVKKGLLARSTDTTKLRSIEAMRLDSSGAGAAIISTVIDSAETQNDACFRKTSYNESVLSRSSDSIQCTFIFEPTINQNASELTPESLLPTGTEFSLFRFEDIRYSPGGEYLYIIAFYKQIISIDPLNTPFVRSIIRYNVATKQGELLFSSLTNSNIIANGSDATLIFADYITSNNNFMLATIDEGENSKIIKIDLNSGEFTTLFSDSTDTYYFQGLWLSEDGTSAKVHRLGNPSTKQTGKGRILSWSAIGGEKVLKCKTTSARYSENFASPSISSDGETIAYQDTDKLIERAGIPGSVVAIFDTNKKNCIRLGSTSRTFHSSEPVISHDGKLVSYTGLLDRGSQSALQFVYSAKTSDFFKHGR